MTLDEAAAQLPEGYTLYRQRRMPRCRVWLDTPDKRRVRFFAGPGEWLFERR